MKIETKYFSELDEPEREKVIESYFKAWRVCLEPELKAGVWSAPEEDSDLSDEEIIKKEIERRFYASDKKEHCLQSVVLVNLNGKWEPAYSIRSSIIAATPEKGKYPATWYEASGNGEGLIDPEGNRFVCYAITANRDIILKAKGQGFKLSPKIILEERAKLAKEMNLGLCAYSTFDNLANYERKKTVTIKPEEYLRVVLEGKNRDVVGMHWKYVRWFAEDPECSDFVLSRLPLKAEERIILVPNGRPHDPRSKGYNVIVIYS